MKITSLFLTALFWISVGQAQALDFCENLFGKDGSIAPAFWNLKAPIVKPHLESAQFVQAKDLLGLIRQAFDDDSKDAVQKLMSIGFIDCPFDKARDTPFEEINSLKSIDNRFYLCNASCHPFDPNDGNPPYYTALFIIDSNTPATACRVDDSKYFGLGDIAVDSVEKIDPNSFRFFLTGFSGNGRLAGAPHVETRDIDFVDKKVSWTEGSFAEDIDGDGHRELIVSSEVIWNLNWYWVLKYEDGKWVDESRNYPDFYKTRIAKIYQAQGDFRKYEYIHQALIRAAEAGGPSAFAGNETNAIEANEEVPFKSLLATGKKLLAEKDYSGAVTAYQSAASLNPEDDNVFVYMGFAYYKNSQEAEAEVAYRKAIQLNSKSALAHYNLALCKWVFRDSDADADIARVELGQALDLDPNLKVKVQDDPKFRDILLAREKSGN